MLWVRIFNIRQSAYFEFRGFFQGDFPNTILNKRIILKNVIFNKDGNGSYVDVLHVDLIHLLPGNEGHKSRK